MIGYRSLFINFVLCWYIFNNTRCSEYTATRQYVFVFIRNKKSLSPEKLSIQDMVSENDCELKCVQIMECTSYDFHQGNQSCELNSNEEGVTLIKEEGWIHAQKKSIPVNDYDQSATKTPVVKTSYYNKNNTENIEEFVSQRYTENPERTEWLNNLDVIQSNPDQNNFIVRIQALFIAPKSAEYEFVATCDDYCKVYLSKNESAVMKDEIINVNDYTNGYNIWSRGKKSKRISLEENKVYYIEGILMELGTYDYMSIGVYYDVNEKILPITAQYLKEFKPRQM